MIEELTPMLLSGLLLLVLMVAPVVTLLLSALLLGLYRRSVSRHMEVSGTFGDAIEGDPTGDPADALASDRATLEESALYREVLRRPWSAARHYIVAGTAFALVFAVAAPFVYPHRLGLPGYLTGFLYYLWPVVLALLLTVPSSWRVKAAYTGAYFALFLIVVAWASTVLDQPAYQVGSITIPARSTANPVTNLRLWAVLDGAPTLLMLVCFNRRIRAVAPLVLGLVTTAISGLLIVYMSLFTERGTDATVATAVALRLDVRWLLLAAVLLSLALFGAAGWWLARRAAGAYRRKQVSDQSLTLDALFLLFAAYYAMWLVLGGLAWAATAVVAYAAYKVSLGVSLRLARERAPSGRGLTFLRVFSLGSRSERLLESVAGSWRHVGSVQMIIGPDVARSMVQPDQFLDFLSGKLGSHFVRDPDSLERSLAECDRGAGRDGRFRINNFFCQTDSWRRVLPRLIGERDVVLMDLRSFSVENEGCVHELGHLIRHVPLERCRLIVDETTEMDDLAHTLEETWRELPAGSPNRARSPDEVPLHPFASGAAARRDLLRSLCAAAGQ